MHYRIVVEETDTGFSAYSPDVPGVGVAGDTREETEHMLHEAIAFQQEPDYLLISNVVVHGQQGASASVYGVTASSLNGSGMVPPQSDMQNWTQGGPQRVTELA